MTDKKKSQRTGVSKQETTGTLPDMQFSGAERPSNTSVISASTAEQKSRNGSQRTPNSPNVMYSQIVRTFAAKLGELVEWRRLELADGREVMALVFPLNLWTVTTTNALVPKEK